MKKIAFVFFTCLIVINSSFAQQNEVQIVLLAGQSNMAGHGNYEELDESVKKRIEKVADRVFISTSEKASRPLSYYITETEKYNFNKHFGPEIFIGLTLAEANPYQEFLIIKKAVGGTTLYGAWNANWTMEKADVAESGSRKKMELFKEHLNLISSNLERLKLAGKSYKIIGLAWMQGESDTNKEETASNYKTNLENLIVGYRNQLNLKEMPVVIGQVNPLPRKFKEGPAMVRNAMEEIANSTNNVEIIKTSININWSDFPKHSDNLHYNTIGQEQLGMAFANKILLLNQLKTK